MKNSFKKALEIFKYSSIIYTIAYWIYMFIDDWVFIQKDGINIEGIGIWFRWFFVYFSGFVLSFWIISLTLILIYHKLIKRKK